MIRKLLCPVLLLASMTLSAQKYTADWSSIDSRPVPGWFEDAKFGIFIHWGVYSVPAWGPVGSDIGVYDKYSEWYWNKLLNKSSKVNSHFKTFHEKTYGADFKYQDFAPMFKAELFNPGQWATLFRDAGAKYVVLTSKHHEGFTLWPSAQSWNWNSVDIGPHRDICGDLTSAVKKEGLRMGFYYSLYEWFNPVYLQDREGYVDHHMIPQMKDLVNRYSPDIVWTDGEWDMTSDKWKSVEFLAWLYNDSPVKESVVVNDRWGSETRSKHGGIYTTEYGLIGEKEGIDESVYHPWEECRGIGTSFGFNRTENFDSYSTTEELIEILISTVSKGGNLLLDIGPADDGTIPVIMQQRLMDIGNWLKVNGEAIYGTRAFVTGNKGTEINPEAGNSLFFTKKGKDLYILCTEWPEKNIVLKGLGSSAGVKAEMLGSDARIAMKAQGGSITIVPPRLSPDDYQPAYLFRLSNILR